MAAPTFTESAAPLPDLYGSKPLIRAVNFHNTSAAKAPQYEREIEHYSQAFSSVNEDELDQYITTGRWHKSKPGLIVSVYEGYRNGHDVIAPILERHGLIGWFFIITGFIDSAIPDQLPYALSHRIGMRSREYADGRYAMTWDEIRQLERKHVIASHAISHSRLSVMDPATLEREVMGSQEDFRKNLGHKVRAFSSLTGPAAGEFPATDAMVAKAGYDFVFSNYRIQRVNAKA
jgi:hypothetical protein